MTRKCPICEQSYNDHPARSRKDNKTEICPDCGVLEALMVVWEHQQSLKFNESKDTGE